MPCYLHFCKFPWGHLHQHWMHLHVYSVCNMGHTFFLFVCITVIRGNFPMGRLKFIFWRWLQLMMVSPCLPLTSIHLSDLLGDRILLYSFFLFSWCLVIQEFQRCNPDFPDLHIYGILVGHIKLNTSDSTAFNSLLAVGTHLSSSMKDKEFCLQVSIWAVLLVSLICTGCTLFRWYVGGDWRQCLVTSLFSQTL